jgi:hypothetical protein
MNQPIWRARGIGLGCAVAAALTLTGCPNPQTYGTPRTVAKGKVTHTVAAEGMYVGGEVTTTTTTFDAAGNPVTTESKENVTAGFPLPPTYQVRIGASDQVDIGIKVSNMTSLGADVKVNPVRGDFDLAVDPGLQWFGVSGSSGSVNVVYLHLPLLLGFNLSQDFSLVLTPGVLYSFAASSVDDSEGESAVFETGGLAGRLGLGFDARFSPTFALHPEVTAIRGVTGDMGEVKSTIVLFGLGFNIANIPDYSDVQ